MRACIYLVTNLVNGKFYIGKTTNLKSRWSKHLSTVRRKNPKDYTYLHRGINKYGADHSQLVEGDVLEIRQKYIPQKYSCAKLAREYGVSDETIRKIVKKISWSHVL